MRDLKHCHMICYCCLVNLWFCYFYLEVITLQLSAVCRVYDLLILVQIFVGRITYALRFFKFLVGKHYCKARDESRIPVSDGS